MYNTDCIPQTEDVTMTAYCYVKADLTDELRTLLDNFGFEEIEQVENEVYFNCHSVVEIDNEHFYGADPYYTDFDEEKESTIQYEQQNFIKFLNKVKEDLQNKLSISNLYYDIEVEQ